MGNNFPSALLCPQNFHKCQKRVLSAKQEIKQPKKKKKTLGITWLVAFIGHFFAHVEGFSDCLKRSEHGNSLTASVGSTAWAKGGGEVLRDAHQLFTISDSRPHWLNQHLISSYCVQVLGWVLSIQLQITHISHSGRQVKKLMDNFNTVWW